MREYTLIRSSRRTVALEIDRAAHLLVRAPNRMPRWEIERFIEKHERWIAEKLQTVEARRDAFAKLTDADIAAWKEKAREILPELTRQYAARMGVSPQNIKITSARSRYGSCGRNGNICYSWRLMLYPEAAWEYVVVHELCHLKHFDHSKAFYAMIEHYLPDYKTRKALLKEAP